MYKDTLKDGVLEEPLEEGTWMQGIVKIKEVVEATEVVRIGRAKGAVGAARGRQSRQDL